ncbi:hypothetical protein E3V36_00625 [Candidatus Marinimicrobia bacterium MT.SAG.2]|nr:hypothetical protein E3V36_00625 [Candidatus Marinimicrobia bacterium MT.SAG.2]
MKFRLRKHPKIAVVTIALILWGIFWSFYRHGMTHGVLSVVLPPYAVYRGIAAIWEPPEWREHYEWHTEFIATIILSSYNGKPRYKNEYEMARYTNKLNSWISKLPRVETDTLITASIAFGKALIAYSRESIKILQPEPYSDPVEAGAVTRHLNEFKHISGYNSVWNEFQKKKAVEYETLHSVTEAMEPAEKLQLFKELSDSSGRAELRINAKLKELFN